MQRKSEHIDRLFKHALEDYRAVPDDMVWQQIADRLAKKRKNRVLFLITRIAAGILWLSGAEARLKGARESESEATFGHP